VTDAVAVRDAATVMLVRDGNAGLEVFMLRRTLNAVFVGGFYVFPGGAVDDADRDPDVAERCAGLSDAAASELLDVPTGGLAYCSPARRTARSSTSTTPPRQSASRRTATPPTAATCA
jgi:hypothetical protein